MSSNTEEPDSPDSPIEVDERSSQEGKDRVSCPFENAPDEVAELDLALLRCAEEGTYPEAKRLLNLGAKADVLIENNEGKTRSALGNATYRGHYQLVKLFLDHHADPDLEDDLTWRPIANAIFSDDDRMVKVLLEGGADPNVELARWSC